MLKTKTLNKTVTTVLILLLTVSILSVAINIQAVKASPDTIIWVEVGGTGDGSSEANAAGNITYALSVASANEVIKVKPGVYNDTIEDFPLTIEDVNVTIISTGGRDVTIINATGASTNSHWVFYITADNATIGGSGAGFTIDAEGTERHEAVIEVFANRTTIQENKIKGITAGSSANIHINMTQGIGHTIKDNIFRKKAAGEGWGIYADDLEDSVIEGNTFYGDSPWTTNTVEGAPGVCLLIGNASNVNVTSNTAYNVKYGFLAFVASFLYNNTQVDAWYESGRNNTISNVRVTNNTVYNCTRGWALSFNCFANNDTNKVGLLYQYEGNLTIGSNVFIGPSNKIHDNKYGIKIAANCTAAPYYGCVFGAGNVVIYHNDIYGSTGTVPFGVWNGQSGVNVNATLNWWGDPKGPRNATGSVIGDYVSTNVTYTPWLTVPHELDETAAFNIYPTSGPPGTKVGASSQSGTFTAGETVKFYFAGVDTGESTTAESTGAMNGTFTVPEKTAGTYEVGAMGQTSATYVYTTFTVSSPTITLNPNRGSVGTSVTITGLNFNVTGTINMTFAGTQWGSLINANATGGFSASRTVPSKPTGAYTINASDGVNYAIATFTIPSVSISLNVTSGPPGTPVLATGEGFTIGNLVKIFFDSTVVGTTTGDSTGNITKSFTVPGKPSGSYTVNATDWVSGNYDTESFTIPATSIALNVTSGPPGTPVRVYGPNFNCSGTVTIRFDSTVVKTDTANGTGYLNTTFTVPGNTTSSYTVNASDGINYATTPFTIPAPSISLNVTAGPVGAGVRVYGPNFNCSGLVTIYFNASSVKTATANATGYLNTTFTVPSIAIGTYLVNASDGINYATKNFTVGAAIYVSPASGVPGDTVTVTGAGLSANKTVKIYFDTTLVKTVNATSTGGLPSGTNFTVPDATAGAHYVKALDVYTSTYTPSATFTVNSPSITLSPTEGWVGGLVNVTGTNFKLNATVTIYFDSTLVRTTSANGTGHLTANFTVPSVLPGQYTVNATDGVNYATATFNVKGTGGIDTVQSLLREIEAKLDESGSFYNFVNTWFTTISNKLGTFTGTDTVASLLYTIKGYVDDIDWTDITAIKTAVETDIPATLTAIKAKTDTIDWTDITTIKNKVILAPSEAKFDFGTETSLWENEFIKVTPSTEYSSDLGYGWTNTTGLYSRDRGAPDYARRDLVFSSLNKTFKVDLSDGNYTVIVTLGDQSYAHDNMTIYAEGDLKATVSTGGGTIFAQKVFIVSVTDGSLELTFVDAGGVDANWVINTLIIQRSWSK